MSNQIREWGAAIFVALGIGAATIIPTAVDIEINANDSYKSIDGDKFIIENGEYRELSTWKEFEETLEANSQSDTQDTAIQVYIENEDISNWSGLWRDTKGRMLKLGIKDSIWELNMVDRAELFDSIETYINPINKGTRTIQFIAFDYNTSMTINFMEIKSTSDNSVDSDFDWLQWLQYSTPYENKETNYYILYGVGIAVAFIVEITTMFLAAYMYVLIKDAFDIGY